MSNQGVTLTLTIVTASSISRAIEVNITVAVPEIFLWMRGQLGASQLAALFYVQHNVTLLWTKPDLPNVLHIFKTLNIIIQSCVALLPPINNNNNNNNCPTSNERWMKSICYKKVMVENEWGDERTAPCMEE